MDNFQNYAAFQFAAGYSAAATSVDLTADPGASFPTPPANGSWYNATDYASPDQDPAREIVRITARAGATLTIARAQEGTAAVAHNTVGKVYKLWLGPTAKTFNVDIPADIANLGGGNIRMRAGFIEIYNAAQALWFPLTCVGNAGVETLRLSDVGTNNP